MSHSAHALGQSPSDAFSRQINCDALKTIYAAWAQKCRDGRLPGRAEIDPTEMPECMQYMMIFDVEEHPRRYRYRFVGTHIDARSSDVRTGRYLDEIDLGKLRGQIIAMMHGVADDRAPNYFQGQYEEHCGRPLQYERVAMPLASDGENVDAILVGIEYVPLTDEPPVPSPFDAEPLGDAATETETEEIAT